MFNDEHTPDHKLEKAGSGVICLTCIHQHRMAEIEEAISVCQREGIKLPEFEGDDSKEAWFDKMTSEGIAFGENEPF